MGSEMPIHDFMRKFKHYGVATRHASKHAMLEKTINGVRVLFPVAVKHNKVDALYVHKARRRFGLLPKDGVSDKEFNDA
jgi:hypothetical protein